ncbi:MAG: hypothetical protein HOM68_28705 [Gemmatimonadetes bacterium]|nr:hypothetical protein [Gemmatimonadota bacterium]MBT5141814.1 hypothetical protein [Gemmatimonadota bacterium]MBT5588682.1 hypothetical protein [Gemmatimonadota bacterium]MBT5962550.1 hypothetical protein [Gemmatimonadota bacterium]
MVLIQEYGPDPRGCAAAVLGLRRVLVDESVAVVVDTVDGIFVEQPVPVVVELAVASVLVELPVTVIVDLLVRTVFVDESIDIVVLPVRWIFVDRSIAIVIDQFDGIFVDQAIAVVVGDQLDGPTAAQVEAARNRAQGPRMCVVTNAPTLDLGVCVSQKCGATRQHQ